MATYNELRDFFGDGTLRRKVEVAVIIAASSVKEDPAAFPTASADATVQANRQRWAARAFNNPAAMAQKVVMAVLADNKDATVANINAAPDASIQVNVNEAVDLLAQYDFEQVV